MDERYTGALRKSSVHGYFNYCGYKRCEIKIPVYVSVAGWKVHDSAVVVSLDGGERKLFYCSTACASKALKGKDIEKVY